MKPESYIGGVSKVQKTGADGGAGARSSGAWKLCSFVLRPPVEIKVNRIDRLHSGESLSSLQVTALEAKAC